MVVAIVALGTALASVALPSSAGRSLDKDAERLAALLEAARARSRTTGIAVYWRPTDQGFAFDGLPPSTHALPGHWLDPRTAVAVSGAVALGPEPIIPAQEVTLYRLDGDTPALRVTTDGLHPFRVESGP